MELSLEEIRKRKEEAAKLARDKDFLAQAKEIEKERKEKERKKFVMEMFELWVGREMMEEEYEEYIKKFDSFRPTKEKRSWGLKSFIKEQGLKIKPEHKFKNPENRKEMTAQEIEEAFEELKGTPYERKVLHCKNCGKNEITSINDKVCGYCGSENVE